VIACFGKDEATNEFGEHLLPDAAGAPLIQIAFVDPADRRGAVLRNSASRLKFVRGTDNRAPGRKGNTLVFEGSLEGFKVVRNRGPLSALKVGDCGYGNGGAPS
jgi:hypothetical protein